MSGIGREVKRLREGRGWSQAELAVYAGSSQPTVNQIETGKRNPSTATLEKLAEALGVEVGSLFPKGQAPLPLEGLDEQQRRGSPSLRPLICLVNKIASRWERVLEPPNGEWASEVGATAMDLTEVFVELSSAGDPAYDVDELNELAGGLDSLDRQASRLYFHSEKGNSATQSQAADFMAHKKRRDDLLKRGGLSESKERDAGKVGA